MPDFNKVTDVVERYVSTCGKYRLNAYPLQGGKFYDVWHVPGGNEPAQMLVMGDGMGIVKRVAELHEIGAIDIAEDGPFPLDYRKNPPSKELAEATAKSQDSRTASWAKREKKQRMTM